MESEPTEPTPSRVTGPGARRQRTVLAVAALLVALLLVALGYLLGTAGDDDPAGQRPEERTRAAPAPAPPPRTDRSGELAVGLVSRDVAALTPPSAGPIAGYDAAREVVTAMAPRHLRIDVRWDQLQPSADAPLDPDRVHDDGCGRDAAPPCGPPASLSAVLAQVAAQQRAHPGAFRPLITFWGMPEWAGEAPAEGCRHDRVRPGARPLAPGREDAYQAAIRSVWTALRDAGISESDWTPWNEPNAPYFLDPQRASCTRDAEPRSPAPYGRMAVAMDEVLRALRGEGPDAARDHRLVLGEVAAWGAPSSRAVPADEFLRALPDDVLCRADVVGLHGYLDARPRDGRGEPVAAALGEVERRPCLASVPVWITETGVGAPGAGRERSSDRATLHDECRLMHDQLTRWYHHPRITAALQYSVRDDAAFPTGLVDEAVERTYPVAAAWAAWGGRRAPDGPPPTTPSGCLTASPDGAASAPPG